MNQFLIMKKTGTSKNKSGKGLLEVCSKSDVAILAKAFQFLVKTC